MKKIKQHILIVIKLLVLLLFTVNGLSFEFRPIVDNILNQSSTMRLISLYILCLTYIISVEEKLDIWDFIDAFLSTAFFLLFITPTDISKTNSNSDFLTIPMDELSGYK